MPPTKQSISTESAYFWILVGFLFFVFLTGGGSRPDVQSLVILRPVAVLACGVALAGMTKEQLFSLKPVLLLLGACALICVVQLVPLPPFFWQLLPGREIAADIDKVVGIGEIWRPITLVPWGTKNALYSLAIPMAVFLLMVRIPPSSRQKLLVVILAIGVMSGLIGVLQAVGDPSGPLYFYRVTNNGVSVGLFANRNHQAAFLATLFPMLAVFATKGVQTEEQGRFKAVLAISVAVVLVPLLLVTGSRAGLLLGLIGLGGAALLYRRPTITVPKKRKIERINPNLMIAGAAIVALVAITVLSSRAVAIQRLLSPGDEDTRWHIWKPTWEMVGSYFPIGSGIGSFVEVFQVGEPDSLLQPSYVNHAHNDFLEILLTAGFPGLALVAWATFLVARQASVVFERASASGRNRRYGQLGFLILAMLSLASIADYPVRTPSLSALFVIALVWLFGERERSPQ